MCVVTTSSELRAGAARGRWCDSGDRGVARRRHLGDVSVEREKINEMEKKEKEKEKDIV